MSKYQDLHERRAQLALGGGKDKIDAQHAKGKLTARERIEYFFDAGTFVELNKYAGRRNDRAGLEGRQPDGDGVITGYGLVKGQRVFVFAQDFTCSGGSIGEKHALKIVELQKKALGAGCPIVGLIDSDGVRTEEGVDALAGLAEIFFQHTKASGIVPQISVVMGPCVGGAAYSPALTDFVFMVEGAGQMFLSGPDIIANVAGEQITALELGGADMHTFKSGVAHFGAADEHSCFEKVKNLLSYLPSRAGAPLPKSFSGGNVHAKVEELNDILPDKPNEAYDMRDVIKNIADDGEILESHKNWAKSIITCYARIDGTPVGIVASQPNVSAGSIDMDCATKAARFIRTCDAFGIPLITLVDAPGFLASTGQEHAGAIRHGASLLYAYSEATVPKITVILRKAYGEAFVAMCSRGLGADIVYAWPQAEIAAKSYEEAATTPHSGDTAGEESSDFSEEKLAGPYAAAHSGYLDDVIEPRETREKIIQALLILRDKNEENPPKKHGNIPF